MTMLEKAARAAAVEIAKIRRTRIPAFPGSWKTYEGLGFDNLDEVSTAVARAVVMAVREPDDSVRRSLAGGDYTTSQRDRDDSYEYVSEKNVADFCRDMIDAILNEGQP